MSTDTPGRPRVRASDAEREQLAQALRAAMTEGRLSLDEGEQRLAKAYAATYRDELGPLTADLPDGGWRALFETPEALAEGRRQLRRLRGAAAAAALLVALVIGAALLSGAPHLFLIIPLAFLTLGILRRGRCGRWHARAAGPPWARSWAESSWAGPPWVRPWNR